MGFPMKSHLGIFSGFLMRIFSSTILITEHDKNQCREHYTTSSSMTFKTAGKLMQILTIRNNKYLSLKPSDFFLRVLCNCIHYITVICKQQN